MGKRQALALSHSGFPLAVVASGVVLHVGIFNPIASRAKGFHHHGTQ
jgi:hypothetical protein